MKKSLVKDGRAIIVLTHGAFEHSGRYDWLIEQFNEHHFHVIYGDLPGHGTSEGKRGHIHHFQHYINTVSTWVDEAATFNVPTFLFGHSMGGLITIRLLQQMDKEVTGVILSSPALGLLTGLPKPLFTLSKALNITFPQMKFPTGVNSHMATTNEMFHQRDAQDPLYLKKVTVRWYHEFEKAIKQAFLSIDDYANIPTYIIQAGEDKLVDKNAVQSWYDSLNIKDKSFKMWEQLYHELLNEPERQTVFNDVLHYINERIN